MRTTRKIESIFCLLAVAALLISVCQGQPASVQKTGLFGVYNLVSADGKAVPANVSHEGVNVQVRSGTLTINADGTCSSKMVFVPPPGTEVTNEVTATYTRDGSKLTMQWKGAGTTVGTINGNAFTMENEGMVLVYRK